MTLQDSKLPFKHILNLPTVCDRDNHGPIILFDIVDENFIINHDGIYLIVQEGEKVMYCGMRDTKSFRNTLLFNNAQNPHFHDQDRIRELIGEAIEADYKIKVYAQTADALNSALAAQGNYPNMPLTLRQIRNKLIDIFNPPWNKRRN